MNPTPWKAVKHNPVNVTIEDANGVALATAHQFPPYCDSMETATRIVEAVNGYSRRMVEAVREMRNAQREYFRTRTGGALDRAKRAERAVDAILAEADGKPKQEVFNL